MESIVHVLSLALMLVFALGVLGCAITIPICAFKFFAILFEPGEPQPEIAGYRLVPVYQGAEPASAPAPPAPQVTTALPAQPPPPRARGAAAGK